MIWSLETDDFLGKCDGVKYPLLTAINSVLSEDVTVSTITHIKHRQKHFQRKEESNHYEHKSVVTNICIHGEISGSYGGDEY